MNILDALRHPHLFGALPAFRDLKTWGRWLIVLSAFYGLPLDAEGQEFFCKFTGRTGYSPPDGGWKTLALCTGRQAGKSRVAATVAAWEAGTRDGAGEYAVILAQDRTAATRALMSYACEPFETQECLFNEAFVSRTQDTLSLNTGATLAVYPCRPASVRGIRARCVVLDELDFMSSPDGRDVGREVLTAARPCLATTGGRLVVLSSPGRVGSAFHRLVSANWGRDDSDVLVIRASAPELNPTLGADYLRSMEADPSAYKSEVAGEWVEAESQLFDSAALDACVVSGRVELPPEACRGVVAFADPAAGNRGGDRFALALGYRDGARVVIAALRAWSPPFSPAGVVEEVADICKRYGVRSVTGDRFGGNVVAELFRSNGLAYQTAPASASDLYMDLLPVVSAGGVELPDPTLSKTAADLMADLRSIVRRPGGAGRDRAEAPRGSGRAGHADLGNAVAGLVAALPAKRPGVRVTGAQLSAAQPMKRGAFAGPVYGQTIWNKEDEE